MEHPAKLKRRAVHGPLSSFWGEKSFLKIAWDGCGKRDKLRFCNSLHVPNTFGTSLGQVGTNLGQNGLTPVFAILHILSRCVGPWDNGTGRDNQILDL